MLSRSQVRRPGFASATTRTAGKWAGRSASARWPVGARACGRCQPVGRFWERFARAAVAGESAGPGAAHGGLCRGDWRHAEAPVTQAGETAHVVLVGEGDLDADAAQVRRLLALDVYG